MAYNVQLCKTAHEAHLSEAIRGWQLGLNPNRPPHHRRRRPVGSAAKRGSGLGARAWQQPAQAREGASVRPPAGGARPLRPQSAQRPGARPRGLPRRAGARPRHREGARRGRAPRRWAGAAQHLGARGPGCPASMHGRAAPAACLPSGAAALPQEHEAWPRHKRSPLAARGSPGARGSRGPGGERAAAWRVRARPSAAREQRPRLPSAVRPRPAGGRPRGGAGAFSGPLSAWVRWPPMLSRAGTAPAMRARRPALGGPWARRPWPKTTNRGQKKNLSNVA
jgi:hypothetical protein